MIHICETCSGKGRVCPDCGRHHRLRNTYRLCRSRRAKVPCPGIFGRNGSHEPHVDSFSECDVCRLQVAMLGSAARSELGWGAITNPNPTPKAGSFVHLHLCADCLKRHGEIQTMTLEYLMGDRGGLRMGQRIAPSAKS